MQCKVILLTFLSSFFLDISFIQFHSNNIHFRILTLKQSWNEWMHIYVLMIEMMNLSPSSASLGFPWCPWVGGCCLRLIFIQLKRCICDISKLDFPPFTHEDMRWACICWSFHFMKFRTVFSWILDSVSNVQSFLCESECRCEYVYVWCSMLMAIFRGAEEPTTTSIKHIIFMCVYVYSFISICMRMYLICDVSSVCRRDL